MNPIARTTVIAVLVVILMAVLVAVGVAARQRAKLTHCQNNLRELGRTARQVLDDWSMNPPTEQALTATGRKFWHECFTLLYQQPDGSLKFPPESPYRCPMTGNDASYKDHESIDYRGPSRPPLMVKDDIVTMLFKKGDILAADRVGNHRGGDEINVLLPDLSVSNNRKDAMTVETRPGAHPIDAICD